MMTKQELITAIEKRIHADKKMVQSSNNNSHTSRCYYEGKLSAFKIVLKLLMETDMTRLDRVLRLLEEYDDLVAVAFTHYCVGQDCRKMLEYLRKEKDQLRQELIEHGCMRKN